MAAILYADLELKRKVDWRTLLTRNKRNRTEYVKKDVPDNFSTFQQNIALDAHGAN